MNGASVELNKEQLTQFQNVLNGLGKAALKEEFWASIGAVGESQIRGNISRLKQDPETGTPWEKLSEEYAERKAKVSSGGILERDNHLLDSITFDESQTGVEIGTNLIYATTHQFGAKKGSFGNGAPWGDIPARPFIGFTDFDELQTTVLEWYGEVVRVN